MKKKYLGILISTLLFLLCIVMQILVTSVDVKPIGPNYSVVGLATMNGWFENLVGVNFTLYDVSTYLGIVMFVVPISFVGVFIYQWIKRKKFMLIDSELILLFITYGVVFAFYILYEYIGINYRPVLINGELEPSFPSSHTMLAITIAGTSLPILKKVIVNKKIRIPVYASIELLALSVILGRTLSGVHWLSDIIGGMLFASLFVSLYKTALTFSKNKEVD